MSTVPESQAAPEGLLVDMTLDSYILWREECNSVQQTYEDWVRSAGSDREVAFNSYMAALDWEELAANAYAERIKGLAQACL